MFAFMRLHDNYNENEDENEKKRLHNNSINRSRFMHGHK